MSIRYKLANWISGGELDRKDDEINDLQDYLATSFKHFFSADLRAQTATDALRRIEAMETPRCAHIGKRMAKVAREARG